MYVYVIALGSNRRHGRHGAPRAVLAAAVAALSAHGIAPIRMSPIVDTPALGPAGRRFANAALLARTPLEPPDLLASLKTVERAFGRRRGRRWGTRVLDLDILLWSGGAWRSRALAIPHAALAERRFVLDPLVSIAPDWRIPSGASVRQLRARLTRPLPNHRAPDRSGP
ncbi:2-amino-4-hydroxy-6-hydroxymethyldihydropteridine diphosphokinase [Sphingomonas nostoxanthinifaciens]|uniref:2-amino-4-hydroxy-6- hydroxymethyldihydropteridine diphosphokinase n=1 Tax=Sphingomonas nostoxanthinifaciens TaxID=2872652 RepID=UPI001CC1EEB9|nr:2-amino-4-hydroxy-6-hydroxymethyldihydropteridine diphosphokinase [Sphingomonas nostoxanthinifaciens]UAK24530.1 2-amino-4-hydroxy-6-hydroxymethyldihydropteridine diphosphokinase [Sphingomonas nostoxanthinifaciens]